VKSAKLKSAANMAHKDLKKVGVSSVTADVLLKGMLRRKEYSDYV
jgi:hypothetical protein